LHTLRIYRHSTGAVVIDVGINAVDDAAAKRGYRLVGDVAFDEVSFVGVRVAHGQSPGFRVWGSVVQNFETAVGCPLLAPAALHCLPAFVFQTRCQAAAAASLITPVPGGVGPMTIAMLLQVRRPLPLVLVCVLAARLFVWWLLGKRGGVSLTPCCCLWC
jgi:hypothetical protein